MHDAPSPVIITTILNMVLDNLCTHMRMAMQGAATAPCDAPFMSVSSTAAALEPAVVHGHDGWWLDDTQWQLGSNLFDPEPTALCSRPHVPCAHGCSTLTGLMVKASIQYQFGDSKYTVKAMGSALGLIDGQLLKGACSPPSTIDLDDNARLQAGIPRKARYYSFAYPLGDGLLAKEMQRLKAMRKTNRSANFMTNGGFLYLDASKKQVRHWPFHRESCRLGNVWRPHGARC